MDEKRNAATANLLAAIASLPGGRGIRRCGGKGKVGALQNPVKPYVKFSENNGV
jgi:hypothetical protein